MCEFNYQMNEKGFQTKTEFGELFISPDDQHGFRPYFLLVSAVAGCAASLLRVQLDKLDGDFDKIDVRANVTREKEEANRVSQISFVFKVYSENLSMDTLKEAMKITYKESAMIQSVKDSIEIDYRLEIV